MVMHAPNGIFLEVGPNGNLTRADSEAVKMVDGGLARLMTYATPKIDARGRTRWDTHNVSMKLMEQHLNGVEGQIRSDAAAMGRTDSFAPGLGMFNPRALTQQMRRVLEERRAPLNGRMCFDINTEVAPGTLKYEQFRTYATGEASVWRGGGAGDVGSVELAATSRTAPVLYLISKFSQRWLENLRINRTGMDIQLRKMRAAVRAIGELENRFIWQGSNAHNLLGVLNHPYVEKLFTALDFGTATVEQISQAMHEWANYNRIESKSVFTTDTLTISPRLHSYMLNKKFGNGDRDTIMDHFRRANPHITRIKEVNEFQDAGPGGSQVLMFHRRGAGPSDRSAEIVQVMGTTILPPDTRNPLMTTTHLVAGFGGVNFMEVGDCLIVFVPFNPA